MRILSRKARLCPALRGKAFSRAEVRPDREGGLLVIVHDAPARWKGVAMVPPQAPAGAVLRLAVAE